MSADGKWSVTADSPMGKQTFDLTIKTSGSSFTGSLSGPMGAQDISGSVEGDKLTWVMDLTQPMPLKLAYDVTISGDTLTGNVKAGAFGNAPLNGKRA